MDEAKAAIRRTLDGVKALVAGGAPPDLSESDTKAHSVERLLPALGWDGVGVVTREFYVTNSQEYVDYALRGPDGRLVLAIEAKRIRLDLADKHAAQLVQYCVIAGIEWAVLTNGRQLQFFNTFLKGDLVSKRVMHLELVGFKTDAEFDRIFEDLWRLSSERLTDRDGMAAWLRRWRMDAALRAAVSDPGAPMMRQLRATLAAAEVSATPEEIARWFRENLTPSAWVSGAAPDATSTPGQRPGARLAESADPDPAAEPDGRGQKVRVADLILAGVLPVGTNLTLSRRGAVAARATVDASGRIVLDGIAYDTPSAPAFARLLGNRALNGWTAWRAELPQGPVSLDELRRAFARGRSAWTGESDG